MAAYAERLESEIIRSVASREVPLFSRTPPAKESKGKFLHLFTEMLLHSTHLRCGCLKSEKSNSLEDESKALRRRAKYFLLIQAASVMVFILFSTFSIEVVEDDINDDDDDTDDL